MLRIAWSPLYAHPLPENHRFPMEKYNLIPEQLIFEGTISEKNFFTPEPLEEQYITNTHEASYWDKLKRQRLSKPEIRRTGFPMSEQLVRREITIMNGTLQAALYALDYGIAFNIAGGTHHSFTNKGEGFCLLNDIAIAANFLLDKNIVRQVLVIDLDVHQGNGTAQIFSGNPDVFTFSMHGEKNYPLRKEQSDLDVGLPDRTDDIHYMQQLNWYLPRLIDEVEPDFIFYQSGVDILESDKLGRLGVSIAGCRERDRLVLSTCKRHKIPVALSMGGGYSEIRAHIIEAHANTYRLAQEIYF